MATEIWLFAEFSWCRHILTQDLHLSTATQVVMLMETKCVGDVDGRVHLFGPSEVPTTAGAFFPWSMAPMGAFSPDYDTLAWSYRSLLALTTSRLAAPLTLVLPHLALPLCGFYAVKHHDASMLAFFAAAHASGLVSHVVVMLSSFTVKNFAAYGFWILWGAALHGTAMAYACKLRKEMKNGAQPQGHEMQAMQLQQAPGEALATGAAFCGNCGAQGPFNGAVCVACGTQVAKEAAQVGVSIRLSASR